MKALVAMSGGVDSSVAAYLMREQGWDAVGVTMCLGVESGDGGGVRCCGPEAVADARKVCDTLDMPHYVFDFAESLQRYVIEEFVAEYRQGRTPNPCVRCNQRLKFGLLLTKARAMGFDAIVTGHYARIEELEGEYHLMRPRDRDKDQTYFLYQIKRQDLPSIRFPLGELTKSEVRQLAGKAGLTVAGKPASQDICFVTEDNYRTLVGDSADDKPGQIVDTRGKVLGTHRGISHFTVGQRRGLGIAAGRRLFVVAIDPDRQQVIVGDREDLAAYGLRASSVNMLTETIPGKCEVQIRYAHPAVGCTVEVREQMLEARFAEPEDAVAPGQSAVLYYGDRVLGGGIIEEALSFE